MPIGVYERKSLKQKFSEKVDKNGPIPKHAPSLGRCHLWTGARDGDGRYGLMNVDGKLVGAHRVAFVLHSGRPIPEGMNICHRCDTTLCVRGNHLTPRTQAWNIRDMAKKGRRVEGDKRGTLNGRALLTEEKVLAIRAGEASDAEYAEEYGVALSTIRAVRWRKTWRHLPSA